MYYSIFASPIGELLLISDGAALMGVDFDRIPDPSWQRDDGLFSDAATQLRAYFGGELTEFSLDLAPPGTPFQQRVWAALREAKAGKPEAMAIAG